MDCACALVARGRRLTDVCRSISVSRTQLSVRVHRSSDWQDCRLHASFEDTAVLSRIHTMVAELPAYGYRRVWALLRRQSVRAALPIVNTNACTGLWVLITFCWSPNLLILSVNVQIKGAYRSLRATGAGVQMALSSVAIMVKSCG